MMWIAYFALGLSAVLLVAFFGGLFIAYTIDRKNAVWLELQKDHTQRRRPAAK